MPNLEDYLAKALASAGDKEIDLKTEEGRLILLVELRSAMKDYNEALIKEASKTKPVIGVTAIGRSEGDVKVL